MKSFFLFIATAPLKKILVMGTFFCVLGITSVRAQKNFIIKGCVTNGACVVPNAIIYLDSIEIRTDIGGNFIFKNVSEGVHRIRTYNFENNFDKEIEVRANITLDTIVVEQSLLTPTIWQLQKQTNASDPYMQQYLDFRLAIDSLNIKPIREKYRLKLDINVDSIPDANSVLNSLRGVSIEKGWLLDVKYKGTIWGDGYASFYTRRENEPKRTISDSVSFPFLGLPEHIQVAFTSEGIWSAYQLANSLYYLPKFGHDLYYDHCGIYSLDEIRCRSVALRDSLSTIPEIQNHVTIHDSVHASVTAYWWNDWVGLVEETTFVERLGNSVIFIFPDTRISDPRAMRRILVRYDCGIEF